MTWYYILFFIVIVIFMLKSAISFIAGDMDIDYDLDGDVDFDVSSMLSFKGILHFLIGFSSYLSIIGYVHTQHNETYQLSIWSYIGAFIVGVIFMIGLGYVYMLMKKLNHSNEDNPNFDNCKCTILTDYNNGYYDVLIMTYQGTLKRKLERYDKYIKFNIGDECTIRRINGFYYLVP